MKIGTHSKRIIAPRWTIAISRSINDAPTNSIAAVAPAQATVSHQAVV
jgi:hypothetical protein